MLRCIYSQSLHRDLEGTNNIIGHGTPMWSLYVHIHIELKQNKHVLIVAFTMHKVCVCATNSTKT